tara:strand:- start:3 stop:191 length:189 start_codon:yes stop_codon:yes gene_type:complete
MYGKKKKMGHGGKTIKNNEGNVAAMNRNTKMGGGMMNYNVGGKAKAGTQPMYSEVMPKSGPC